MTNAAAIDSHRQDVLKTIMSVQRPSKRSANFPTVESLCTGTGRLDFWHWDAPGGSSHWRLYWNGDPGAYILCPERTDLDPKHLVLVPPFTPIHTRLEREGVAHFFIHFLLAPPFHNPVRKAWRIPITPTDTARLRRLWGRLMMGQEGRSDAVEMLEWIGRALAAIPETNWDGIAIDTRIHAAVRRMETEMEKPLSVAELARGCNLSPSAFARLFRSQVGESPHQHLMRRRVEHSARLLARTTLTVEAVAEQCGFSDRYHFTHVFKKLRHMAPAEYRRQQAHWKQIPGAAPRQ